MTQLRLLVSTTLAIGLVAGCATAPRAGGEAALTVRNNHAVAYEGPVQVNATLPDGVYRGEGAVAEARDGVVRVVASLAPGAEVTLARTGPADGALAAGALAVAPAGSALQLAWRRARLATLELGLVVTPGTAAGPDDVPAAFRPLELAWAASPDGTLHAAAERDGYRVEAVASPYGGGWLDVKARVTRVAETGRPEYVAVVRRVVAPGAGEPRLRFNGRVFQAARSPDTWDRDFWYTHGVDWMSEDAGAARILHVNGFAPAPTTRVDSVWAAGSHFYVWERTRRAGDALYLISEIAGPNAEQRASGYMRITPYAPMARGDAVDLKWRVAVAEHPAAGWEEGHLRAFAGYRRAVAAPGAATVDVGVRGVEFGTSYFPYSTFTENFDFVRTRGLNQETWWPFSPALWAQWRTFIPRMRTDLHIIRAMGFDWVRLHHLELLQQMDRAEALAYLDFTAGEARALGMKILVDTEGPDEWVELLAGRYPDVIRRFELENEVLIPGIRPSQPARWSSMYRAVKRANPEAQAFLTGAGANGMFERLRALGVPFDRVGLHAYKHGPGWEEAYDSHALGTGGYAADLGLEATLGEFNWKSYTRLSPEARRARFATLYGEVLEPRAIPEVFQFHFQETMSVNPRLSRQGIRHYETIALDRRPKPEALELMRLIRQHARADAPVRELPVQVEEATLTAGRGTAAFTVTNATAARVTVELAPLAFDGVEARLATPARLTLGAGETARGRVELRLPAGAAPGTYHHFVRAAYGGRAAYGWGVVANPGAPRFAAPVLEGQVVYPQGASVVERIDWTRPLAVAYGADAPDLEMEMAYMVASTLQSATGRAVRISSTADLPDSLTAGGTLVLVGTRAGNPMACGTPAGAEQGVVELQGPGRLCLTGADARGVEAAATDFVLRFWGGAKDSAMRAAGMENGAARGNRAGVTNADLP